MSYIQHKASHTCGPIPCSTLAMSFSFLAVIELLPTTFWSSKIFYESQANQMYHFAMEEKNVNFTQIQEEIPIIWLFRDLVYKLREENACIFYLLVFSVACMHSCVVCLYLCVVCVCVCSLFMCVCVYEWHLGVQCFWNSF